MAKITRTEAASLSAEAMFRELKQREQAGAAITGLVRPVADAPSVIELQCYPGAPWLPISETLVRSFDTLGIGTSGKDELPLVTLYLVAPKDESRVFAWASPLSAVAKGGAAAASDAVADTAPAAARIVPSLDRPGQTRCRYDLGLRRWVCPG